MKWIVYTIAITLLTSYTHYTSAQNTYTDSLSRIVESDHTEMWEKANALARLSSYNYKNGHYPEAIDYKRQEKAIYTSMDSIGKIADANEMLGIFFAEISDYSNSLKYLLEALKTREEMKDEERVASIILNIGVTYLEIEDNTAASGYFAQARKYHLTNPDKYAEYLIVNYTNTGTIFTNLYQSDSALYYFQKAKELAILKNFETRLGDIMVNIGNLYLSNNEYDKALVALNEALADFQKNKDNRGISHTNFAIAEAYFGLNRLNEAEERLIDLCEYFKISGDLDYLAAGYKTLSKIFNKRGLDEKALEYFMLHTEVKDSIINTETVSRIAEFQLRYEAEKLESQAEAEMLVVQKNKELAAYKFRLIIGIILLIVIILVFIIYRFKSRKKILEFQLENEALDREKLSTVLGYKKREMENLALHIFQKNELLEKIKDALDEIRKESSKETGTKIRNIILQVQQTLRVNKELSIFQEKVEQLNSDFFSVMSDKYPTLTEKEKRLCALLKLELSSKEIALLNDISEGAVTMARYRLRKKLKLDPNENLTDYLQKIAQSDENTTA